MQAALDAGLRKGAPAAESGEGGSRPAGRAGEQGRPGGLCGPARAAGPRPVVVGDQRRRRPDRTRGARVLLRPRPASWRRLGYAARTPLIATINPSERIRIGTVGGARARATCSPPRPTANSPMAADGRCAATAGGPGADRGGGDRTCGDGWLHQRRHRGDRRRRLRAHRGPQEGADHQRGRQEHVSFEHREQTRKLRLPADRQRAGDRRPPPLRHRARRARPARRCQLRLSGAEPRGDLAGGARRGPRGSRGDPRRRRAREREPQLRRTDQAPHDPARRVAARRR